MIRKLPKLTCPNCRSIVFISVSLLILFGACPALAQDTSKYENKKIRAIKSNIKPSSSMPADTQVSKQQRNEVLQILRANMKSRLGDPYSSDILNKDIKRIVGKGKFWMKVEVVPVPDGVEIKLDITLRPIVKKVFFTDHKGRNIKAPNELLLEIITKEEAYFSNYFITHDQRAIEEHYRNQGYPLVRVEGKAKYTDEGVTVTFQVWKGLYVIMRVINFEGNKFFTYDELWSKIHTPVQNFWRKFFWFSHDAKYKRSLIDEDVKRILQEYRAEGFLDAKVWLKSAKISKARGGAVITIGIDEGVRYHIETVSITGNSVFTTEKLMKKIKMEPGSPYRQEILETDLDAIEEIYERSAYIYRNVRHKVTYGPKGNKLNLVYMIYEGPQIYLDKIRIEGNERTRDRVIRRELSLYPGEKLDRREMRESFQRLINLQFFKNAYSLVEPTDDPGRRTLVVKVEENKTGRIGMGFSYSTAVGLQGYFSLSQINWDFTDVPKSFGDFITGNAFSGGGTSLSLVFQPGSVDSRYSLTYRDPHFMDSDTRLLAGIQYVDSEYTRWDKRSEGFRLGLGRNIGRNISIDMLYRFEINTLTNISPSSPIDVFLSEGTKNLSAIGPSFTFSNVDLDFHGTKYSGWYAKAGYEYAGGFMGGEVDFSSASLQLGAYKKLYEDRDGYKHVLSLELSGFWKEPHHNTKSIPWYERYFLGGSGSLRGFEYRSVGPKEGRDFIGGNVLMTASLEYSVPLPFSKDYLRAAFFVDAGNLSKDVKSFFIEDFRMSTGISFRFKVRNSFVFTMEFGYPLIRFKGDKRRTFHFRFGTEF